MLVARGETATCGRTSGSLVLEIISWDGLSMLYADLGKGSYCLQSSEMLAPRQWAYLARIVVQSSGAPSKTQLRRCANDHWGDISLHSLSTSHSGPAAKDKNRSASRREG